MSSDTVYLPDPDKKRVLYEQAEQQIDAMLQNEVDPIVLMASIVSVLHTTMQHYTWTGFYRVQGNELVIGPYQGTPACLRIGMGKGVCGTAWEQGIAQVVEDVHAFPGHIACDSQSRSEIVVPWRNRGGEISAVLDIDSTIPAAFDEVDQEGLERILGSL